jgi:hypothetical protein
LFASLCRPSAPVDAPGAESSRGLMMPRRTSTRAHGRAKRIDAERAVDREMRENPEIACNKIYFLSSPPPSANSQDSSAF